MCRRACLTVALRAGQPPSKLIPANKGEESMGRLSMLRPVLLGALTLLAAPQSALGQGTRQFTRSRGASGGPLYRPDTGPAPHVGIIVMHRPANSQPHPACTELSRRGFMLLCMTTRFANNEVF